MISKNHQILANVVLLIGWILTLIGWNDNWRGPMQIAGFVLISLVMFWSFYEVYRGFKIRCAEHELDVKCTIPFSQCLDCERHNQCERFGQHMDDYHVERRG